MSEKFASLLAACAVTLVLVSAAVPAAAKDRAIVITATEAGAPVRYVSYRDLNLATLEGEQVLGARVRIAAKDVCIESVQSDAAFAPLFLTCRGDAMRGARPQIARAVTRARDIASKGWSSIAPVAISISVR